MIADLSSSRGRYELRGLLGEGGSGRVYRAFDRVMAREVALKTLKTVSAEDVYRLKKEFRTLVDVAHPHLIRLYELVASPEQCFFTMELIEGPDLLTWVWDDGRPGDGRPLDAAGVARLRTGIAQLVRAAQALHDLGRVHRDIKPSNVLVAPGGRVVLLDVGLVSRLESRQSEHSRAGSIVGTLQYMAPEQTWGREITPAADWYSVGMVLYEGLTGNLPFDAISPRFLSTRRASPEMIPACPRGSPRDLEQLARALLVATPAERPSGDEILAILGDGRKASTRPRANRLFIGRERELANLERMYAASQTGQSVFGRISAPPGFGKTELLATFVARKERADNVLVLRGRCHYREYVMFKALDGVVDSVTRYLARLDASELSDLLPNDADALFHAFPVFRRLETVASLQSSSPTVYDYRLRHRAFVALRELLRRIASRRELIVWIDDLQWADRDSALFLRALQRANPFGRLLCLYTFRVGEPLESYVGALASAAAHGGVVEDLELGPLTLEDASALVKNLAPEATEAQVQSIVTAASAVPLLVQVLCGPLFHRAATLDDSGLRSFDDFMGAITAELTASAKSALQAICVAGYSIEQRLLAALLPRESEAAIARLHEAGLIRQVERERLRWEPAHDKIRESVVAQMTQSAQSALNTRMMRALETLPDPDPHDLLEHLLAGGQTERALERALEAAAVADRRASFQLASTLYKSALELGVAPGERWRVRSRLGQALVNLGLGREGARELVGAAELLAADAPSDPEIVRLRCAAGERLLLGGHWDEGIQLVRDTMAAVGVPQAKSAGGAVLRGIMLMPSAGWQKRRWRARQSSGVALTKTTPLDDLRLEVVWSAGLAIAWLDPMRAIELHVRHAVLAYRAGNLGHIARSKSVEAIILAMQGGNSRWQKAVEVHETAQRLADSSGDRDVQAFIALHWGLLHFFMGRWRDALRLAGQAVDFGYTNGVGAIPQTLLAQWTCLSCQMYLGEIEDVRSRLPDCMMAVEARDEQLSMSCMRLGWVNFVYACDDDIEAGVAEATQGFAPFESAAFNSAHYLRIISSVNAELYRRQPDAAWKVIESSWPGLVSSRQLSMTTVHCEMHDVRGRAALACAAAAVADPERLNDALREVQACAKTLAKNSIECAQPFAAVLSSGAAFLQGRRDDAVEHLERAVMAFSRLEMNMHAACCRWRLAEWLTGQRADEVKAAADSWLSAQNVKQPARVVSVLLAM